MIDEEEPPDVVSSPAENKPKGSKPETVAFPLKDIYEDALHRAREIRMKYSGEQITDITDNEE
jgi:hypothetical protein